MASTRKLSDLLKRKNIVPRSNLLNVFGNLLRAAGTLPTKNFWPKVLCRWVQAGRLVLAPPDNSGPHIGRIPGLARLREWRMAAWRVGCLMHYEQTAKRGASVLQFVLQYELI